VLLGDVPLAQSLLAGAREVLSIAPDATGLVAWIDEAARATAIASSAAVSDLTPAELRVLQFLPTHLTFPEIAERVYVSPNTVKSQAQAVYRKLAVSSRREAVERARGAGLLPQGDRARTTAA
jgi:LuxR family maltose regulon positive regulatory protein